MGFRRADLLWKEYFIMIVMIIMIIIVIVIMHHHHVLFVVREIGPWKEYLLHILCLSNTNVIVVSAIIWLYKQHHLRLLNTVRRTVLTRQETGCRKMHRFFNWHNGLPCHS